MPERILLAIHLDEDNWVNRLALHRLMLFRRPRLVKLKVILLSVTRHGVNTP
jgi:hypothetical protein